MTNHRFPLLSLPNDLCSGVLRSMELYEIIAHSFISKKSCAMVKALRLPITLVQIRMKECPEVDLIFDSFAINFELTMLKNDGKTTNLNDLPVNVNLLVRKINRVTNHFGNNDARNIAFTWSNQGMTIGEWIKHLCSISEKEILFDAEFYVGDMKLDIQSLRNNFPKLRNITLNCWKDETDEQDILYAENVLRVFLPGAETLLLDRVPLGENLSLQHIGMTNLKELEIDCLHHPKFDNFLTLNVESCTIRTDRMPLRDLNRFFKLWMKGSNPKLKELVICWDTEGIPEWNAMLRGLKAKPKGDSRRKFIIKNCRGIFAEIISDYDEEMASIEFTVSN